MNLQATLSDTSAAFDVHAQNYDALVESNPLLQAMRAALWREVMSRVPSPAHLLDLGCGTGIDAAYFAGQGYRVTAIDASREMVNQTRARVTGTTGAVQVENIAAEGLEQLGDVTFDAMYSDLGPLNCVQDVRVLSRQCAAHLKPNGVMILSVMARTCPWEMLYYTLRGDFQQASRRFPRRMVPVNLDSGVVWTRYYDPREFFEFFQNEFQLVTYRSLNLFLPPPYLLGWYQRAGALAKPFAWLDAHLHSAPLLRNMGDHFLITLCKRDAASALPLGESLSRARRGRQGVRAASPLPLGEGSGVRAEPADA